MGQCKSALIAAMGPEEEYNVENADENGNTRLLLAAADGDVGLVRELLEKGTSLYTYMCRRAYVHVIPCHLPSHTPSTHFLPY